ncbi:MAG: DUF1152 domain-containing protein [Anaerolineales bacterium]
MELNLPTLNQLSKCKNLLIAGMGGGFDIFCGLPIYFELKKHGINAHLANFSFSDIENVDFGIRLSKTLVGVTPKVERVYPYFPEFHLVNWFKQTRNEDVTIWCFHKTGAAPLTENYKLLAKHLSLDGILLIDGGVDSLVRGDEAEMGTAIEDLTSLYAVNQLTNVQTRLLACIGFGAEQNLTHAHIFENIASLTKAGGFLGSCSLTPQMESYQAYDEAVTFVQSNEFQDPSVINSSIVSAARGNYGDYHLTEKTKRSKLWISPLMSLYWFFNFDCVVKQNLLLPEMEGTMLFRDALYKVIAKAERISRRKASNIPL